MRTLNLMTLAVSGILGEGKTTFVELFKTHCKEEGIRVVLVEELIKGETDNKVFVDSYIKKKKGAGLKIQKYFQEKLFVKWEQALAKVDWTEETILIFDRTLHDSMVFTDWLYEKNELTLLEREECVQNYHKLLGRGYPRKFDLTITLDTPCETCLKRIKGRGRVHEQKITLNDLILLRKHYSQLHEGGDVNPGYSYDLTETIRDPNYGFSTFQGVLNQLRWMNGFIEELSYPDSDSSFNDTE